MPETTDFVCIFNELITLTMAKTVFELKENWGRVSEPANQNGRQPRKTLNLHGPGSNRNAGTEFRGHSRLSVAGFNGNSLTMKYSLRNKWVLITGASSGFGAAAATAFAAEGARLLLGARRVDRLAQVAEEAVNAGAAEVRFQKLDVTQTASVDSFMAWAKERTDRLHVLINNAGGAHGLDSVANGLDADWEAMLQTNVLGILRVTRAALPLIPHDDGASIINLGSIAARTAYAGGAAYCAAKAGELQLTRALRLPGPL